MPRKISRTELQAMLDSEFSENSELGDNFPEEDLQIIQPDGSRACLNWELAGKGYSIIDPEKELRKKY